MKLKHGLHLAYSTNVHRGGDWRETLASLERHTLAVKRRVCPSAAFGIGLRLSAVAARELSDPKNLREFQSWLDNNDCYVFTINGFPHGNFHGGRVKEQVYQPDWTTRERLEYTNQLFDLLAALVPEGVEGTVSTLPSSFKAFITSPDQERQMRDHLWQCVENIAVTSARTHRKLSLGLEPEPLCWLENSAETIRLFEQLRAEHPGDDRLNRHLGVNYDACHFAVEYEEPAAAVAPLRQHGIRINKLHLSSALMTKPTANAREELTVFAEDTYLHQVVARAADGRLEFFPDLAPALASTSAASAVEWRIHFHIPLHSPAGGWYQPTTAHVTGLLDLLRADPTWCSHLEMETYTWEVLPAPLKARDVVDQLAAEYDWTLRELAARGLCDRPA